MVRAKKAVPQAAANALNEFQADFDRIMAQRKEILERKLEDVELRLITEARELYTQQIPEDLLKMNFFEFLKLQQDQEQTIQNDGEMVTPPAKPRPPPGRLELQTPSGTVVLPSYITPRVDSQRKMRPSKAGEVLFSVTGTPVLVKAGPSTPEESKDDELLELVKKDPSELSPNTASIVTQLKAALKKKLLE